MTPKQTLIAELQRHIGAARGISVEALAHVLDVNERQVRHLVSESREEGVAICAHPQHGYFIAETAEELEDCCAFLRGRALHSLRLEARLRKISLVDLLGQLRLQT
jgi:biotin operon repressor